MRHSLDRQIRQSRRSALPPMLLTLIAPTRLRYPAPTAVTVTADQDRRTRAFRLIIRRDCHSTTPRWSARVVLSVVPRVANLAVWCARTARRPCNGGVGNAAVTARSVACPSRGRAASAARPPVPSGTSGRTSTSCRRCLPPWRLAAAAAPSRRPVRRSGHSSGCQQGRVISWSADADVAGPVQINWSPTAAPRHHNGLSLPGGAWRRRPGRRSATTMASGSSLPLTAGTHRICALAVDAPGTRVATDPPRVRLLTVSSTPYGAVTTVTARASSVALAGWSPGPRHGRCHHRRVSVGEAGTARAGAGSAGFGSSTPGTATLTAGPSPRQPGPASTGSARPPWPRPAHRVATASRPADR
jgi:hypothetical protein